MANHPRYNNDEYKNLITEFFGEVLYLGSCDCSLHSTQYSYPDVVRLSAQEFIQFEGKKFLLSF